MAPTSWNGIKVNIPGVGERAYVFANYRMYNGQCTPNPLNTARACMYIQSTGTNGAWVPGGPFENLYPTLGEWLVLEQTNSNGGVYVLCYKVLELLDEATFLTGTCYSCYNNGHAGDCSDVFITAPPLPGDPNGCQYNNSINPWGIQSTTTNWFNNESIGYTHDAWISNSCVDCTAGTPPTFEPNMVVNCCDPTERYQLDPIYSFSQAVIDTITGTGVNQIGVTNFTQAFRADLYTGGNNTGYKCWHLMEDYPPVGPTIYTITIDPVQKFPDCAHLMNWIASHTNINGPYPPCCDVEPDSGCTSNILQTLQTNLDAFNTYRNNTLSSP